MQISKFFNVSLLVAGTSIGAGMLALPVVTALGGIFPSAFVYFLCWIFSLSTGLLLVEILSWMGEGVNFVSIGNHFFGRKGKVLAWALYLFLFYSLSVAYMAGGGKIVSYMFSGASSEMAIFLFALFFAVFVVAGTQTAGRLNYLLMSGLVVSYALVLLFGIGNIEWDRLKGGSVIAAFLALPVIFTSFSYQGLVPTLYSYLHGNVKWLKRSIIVGTSIPLVVYVIWDILMKGMIPIEGKYGLLEAQKEGLTAVDSLRHFLPNSPVHFIGKCFEFFAITSSLIGVTLGLMDFLSDSLRIAKNGLRKVFLGLVVFVPPMLIAMLNPAIFLRALGYAGGIGCAILLGLIPILAVWKGRYQMKLHHVQGRMPGGKILLGTLFLFVIFEIGIELFTELYA